MRSFVQSPMRYGRLFLAGDAAHTVPPTGAKGLNLAIADVALLAPALARLVRKNDTALADAYSQTALRRVWRCQHFSWWMTSMLHITRGPVRRTAPAVAAAVGDISAAGAAGLAENYAACRSGSRRCPRHPWISPNEFVVAARRLAVVRSRLGGDDGEHGSDRRDGPR